MAIKPMTGLYKHNKTGIWHADKWVNGERIRGSSNTRNISEANKYLQSEIDKVMSRHTDSDTSEPTFRDAAIKYILMLKRKDDEKVVGKISKLFPHLADKPLSKIRKGMLEPFVDEMYGEGKKASTINSYLQIVRSILIRAADEWVWPGTDDPWISYAPNIRMERVTDRREGHPISWAEQKLLLPLLPEYMEPMVLFGLNTGLRADKELCPLRWSWERQVPGSKDTYFLIPGEVRKNGKALAVVLNHVARSIVEDMRKVKSNDYVFNYMDAPLTRMNNHAWKSAKKQAVAIYETIIGQKPGTGFESLNVYDLRHTFATRLRNSDVSEEDIAVLLGHDRGTVTDIYSHARYSYILDKVERVAIEPPDESLTIRQLALAS